MFKLIPNNKNRIYVALPQRDSVKFIQYYNTKQCMNNGSFILEKWLIVTRHEFETFRISCNPFNECIVCRFLLGTKN